MIDKHTLLPHQEQERIKALKSYNVLDTIPEEEYDALTRLAAYICKVPMVLFSLIDDERQWAKSTVGIGFEEGRREDSFCQYTLLGDKIFEIPDTLKNDRVKNHPSVTEGLKLRFYAGAPLIDPNGHRLGSLCVMDTVPRQLSPEQLEALQTLAGEIISRMVLNKQKKELEESLAVHKDFYALFNSSPLIHFIAGKDSKIELINNAVIDVLGYTPQQTIGRPLWEFVAGSNREQFVPLIEKV